MFDITCYAKKAAEIVQAGQFLYQRGWSPATSSNYSARIDAQHIAITVSGKHKGKLGNDDVMVVNLDGEAVQSDCRSSAETLLHTVVYDLYPDVGAVLHTHSVNATVLSRYFSEQDHISFADYELQKAFAGQSTHEGEIVLPVFANTQDIPALAALSREYLAARPETPAYFIRGHGIYTWGKDMDECLRHIEALEFLIECEIQMIRISK
ncbi:MAG: methylthioribulose 1-phosphate dehydratase [Pseudomonadales bacterium]|nr:methylthioribulose 1-phosphate dehydratase [Pseudomonadales bacterium]